MAFVALAIGGASLIGGIASSAIGASAAGNAADTQAAAANHAADLQKQEADASLAFQQKQYDTSQKNLAPWLQAGTGAVGTLSNLTNQGLAGTGPLAPWNQTFSAPTALTEQNDPGYQARLQLGQQALENSAASRGGALSTGAEKNLNSFAQDYASNEYGNVYNRALQNYQTNFNTFQSNATNTFNRYASLAGLGQQAANTLTSSGQAAANNVGNINLTAGQQIGNNINNAGAARASGYIGGANAITGSINSGVGNLTQYLTLQQLLNGGGGGWAPGTQPLPAATSYGAGE